MAEAGKVRTRSAVKKTAAPDADPTSWFCKNCGATSAQEAAECSFCGFSRDYDPDAPVAVDLGVVNASINQQFEVQRQSLRFILEIIKNALLLILVVVLLLLAFRLMRNWPFSGAYESDADKLLGSILTVASYVELGVTKGKYDEIIIPLMSESKKFELKYGDSDKKLLPSYQKLVQAAEYYQLAGDAWGQHLTGGDSQYSPDPGARSSAADEEVKTLWEKAQRNTSLAAQEMR